MALRAQKVSGAFEKWAPGHENEVRGTLGIRSELVGKVRSCLFLKLEINLPRNILTCQMQPIISAKCTM